jgi:4-amino-4-deoxy-L-arabinose transferase-like glycosyltransferase
VHVVAPSARPAQARSFRQPVAALLLLSAVTFLTGLGRQAITDSDEAYYAEAAREMVESGDWLTPHFNYERRWEKPILYYWLTAAAYLIAGPTEAAARFWSALAGVGLVWLTWAAGRWLTGDERVSWAAGAIVATCFGAFAEARLALPDLPLACFITLGIWAGFRAVDPESTQALRWWAAAGLAAGLGFLTKGPVALAVPALVLLPVWWRERRRAALTVRGLAVAAAVFAVSGLPWYAAMWAEHGTAYFQSFFVGDNLERFATTRFNEPRGVWFYIPVLVGGLMPWSAYLLLLSARSAVDVLTRARRLDDVEWRLVLWATMPLLFFTLSIGKQPRYILPVLPPVAILLAASLVRRIEGMRVSDDRALRVATWTTAAAVAGIALVLLRTRPLFVHVVPAAPWLAATAMLAAGAGLGWIAAARAWRHLPIAVALTGVVVLLGVQFGALAGLRPEPVEHVAALVRAHRTGSEPVGQHRVFVRNLIFYTGLRQMVLPDERSAAEFVRSREPVLLVARAADIPAIERQAGVPLHPLAHVRYFNVANLRLRTILRRDPTAELEDVVLVSNR